MASKMVSFAVAVSASADEQCMSMIHKDLAQGFPILTAPTLPALPVFPPPPPPLAAVQFPLGWIFEHASAPIQYRAATEVARLGDRLPAAFHFLPYGFAPAIELAVMQAADGVWNDSMLAVPLQRTEGFEGVGTVNEIGRASCRERV